MVVSIKETNTVIKSFIVEFNLAEMSFIFSAENIDFIADQVLPHSSP